MNAESSNVFLDLSNALKEYTKALSEKTPNLDLINKIREKYHHLDRFLAFADAFDKLKQNLKKF